MEITQIWKRREQWSKERACGQIRSKVSNAYLRTPLFLQFPEVYGNGVVEERSAYPGSMQDEALKVVEKKDQNKTSKAWILAGKCVNPTTEGVHQTLTQLSVISD